MAAAISSKKQNQRCKLKFYGKVHGQRKEKKEENIQ